MHKHKPFAWGRRTVDRTGVAWLGFWLCVAVGLVAVGRGTPSTRSSAHPLHLAALAQFKTVAADGRLLTKPIQDIRPGDTVMARNDSTGIVSPCRVAHVMTHRVLELCILHIQSADDKEIQVLQTTPPHPFWVPGRGWVRAGDLTPGQELLQTDNGRAEVLRVARESHPEGITVFNIEVERDHTYFVAAHGLRGPPVLVHNKAKLVGNIPMEKPGGIRGFINNLFDRFRKPPAHVVPPKLTKPLTTLKRHPNHKPDWDVHKKTTILEGEALEQRRAYVDSDGTWRWAKDGKPLNVDNAIFNTHLDGNTYVLERGAESGISGPKHHSTVGPGLKEDTGMAGNMTVVDGKLKRIDNDSGHYAPKDVEFSKYIAELKAQGVDLTETYVHFSQKPFALKNKWPYTNPTLPDWFPSNSLQSP